MSPGSQPEMIQIAYALMNSNFEMKFLTCGVISKQSIKFRLLNFLQLGTVQKKIRRRVQQIPSKKLKNVGFLLEILVFISNEKYRATLIKVRNLWFSIRTVPYIFYYRPSLVISQGHSNSISIYFARKMRIRTLLNVSIAHHDWMVSEFEKESRINPGWSKFLQHHQISRYERYHLDREIKNADFFLASSSFTVSTFQQQGIDQEKFFIVPLGFDIDKFKNQVEYEERKGLIFVGQLTQRKGISYLIDAFQVISRDHPVQLEFIGRDTGGMRNKLENIPGVSLIPHMNQEDLNTKMQMAKYLFLPSLAEGFALSALEGMACGLIVIISDRTFAQDIISNGENGYILDPRDVEGIVKVYKLLESNSILATKVSRCAKATVEEFTWKNYQDKVYSIINEIVIKN